MKLVIETMSKVSAEIPPLYELGKGISSSLAVDKWEKTLEKLKKDIADKKQALADHDNRKQLAEKLANLRTPIAEDLQVRTEEDKIINKTVAYSQVLGLDDQLVTLQKEYEERNSEFLPSL